MARSFRPVLDTHTSREESDCRVAAHSASPCAQCQQNEHVDFKNCRTSALTVDLAVFGYLLQSIKNDARLEIPRGRQNTALAKKVNAFPERWLNDQKEISPANNDKLETRYSV